jgi:hypothetical protein
LRQMNITFAVQNYCKNTQQDVCCARRCDGWIIHLQCKFAHLHNKRSTSCSSLHVHLTLHEGSCISSYRFFKSAYTGLGGLRSTVALQVTWFSVTVDKLEKRRHHRATVFHRGQWMNQWSACAYH